MQLYVIVVWFSYKVIKILSILDIVSMAARPETVYASARLVERSAIPRNSGTGQSHSRSRSRSCSHRPQDKVSAGVDATETHNSKAATTTTTMEAQSSTNSCFFSEPSSWNCCWEQHETPCSSSTHTHTVTLPCSHSHTLSRSHAAHAKPSWQRPLDWPSESWAAFWVVSAWVLSLCADAKRKNKARKKRK